MSEVAGGARIYRPGTIAYHPPPFTAPVIAPWIDKLVRYVDSVEIIGIISPILIDRAVVAGQDPVSLTHTIFDTTTRADSARILLTNGTGGTRYVTEVAIRGRLITRLQGENGYLHDKFVDYDSISRDGEKLFELGNPFIITLSQVNQLADWHWKRNKTKKHIYSISLIGFQSFFEPGEWYTFTIGSAGEEEYIDSVVECYSVRCSISSSGMGTQVSFREVEENWKFDSNETARFIASGGFGRAPQGTIVTVAPQYYAGYADYYCDGTIDSEEIQYGINAISKIGGGIVQLMKGIYNIPSTITMLSNVEIRGEGPGTVINKSRSADYNIFDATGTSTSYITDISINSLSFTHTGTRIGQYIYAIYCQNISIHDTTVDIPATYFIQAGECNNLSIINNIINGNNSTSLGGCYGINIGNTATSYNIIIQSNQICNMISPTGLIEGIRYIDLVSNQGAIIINNSIFNLTTPASSISSCKGIYVQGLNTQIHSNRIYGIKATATAQTAIGIYIATSSTYVSVNNNLLYNNGLDTGIANTNTNNYRDSGTDTQLG